MRLSPLPLLLLLWSCQADAEPTAQAPTPEVTAAIPQPPAPDAGAPGAAAVEAPEWASVSEEALKAGPRPVWLDLSAASGVSVAGPDLEDLAHGPAFDALEGLDLSGQALGMEGGKALGASGHMGQVQELRLSRCKLGDNGLRAIAYARGFASLRRLDLSFNDGGAIATGSLSSARYLGGLTHLDLRGNAAPSPREAEALGKKLVGIEVLRVDPSWPAATLEALRYMGDRAGALSTEAAAE